MRTRTLQFAFVFALSLGVCLSSSAQQSKGTHRKIRVVDPNATALADAEALMAKQDYAAAEAKLQALSTATPKDYRVWFDLGYVYSETNRTDKAIEAYRRSIDAQPGVLEPNLNLALLLVGQNQPEAGRYLRAAQKLKPSPDVQKTIVRAWISLGDRLQASDPAGAIDAYEQASTLDPLMAYPRLRLGQMYQHEKNDAAAEQQFKAAITAEPSSKDALAALSDLYIRQKRFADAEALLRDLVSKQPASASAHLQLGRVLASEGKHEDAVGEFDKALQLAPTDLDAERGLAASEFELKQYDKAAATLQPLLAQNPNDPNLHYMMGDTYMHAKQFEAAEKEFIEAAKLAPKWADPYGGLAFAASESKNYELAIRALDARAKLAEETPQTYFLRATCYDNLGAKEQATIYYKQFLKVSNGKLPNEEWQAAHRLIAIDPETRKKAK